MGRASSCTSCRTSKTNKRRSTKEKKKDKKEKTKDKKNEKGKKKKEKHKKKDESSDGGDESGEVIQQTKRPKSYKGHFMHPTFGTQTLALSVQLAKDRMTGQFSIMGS